MLPIATPLRTVRLVLLVAIGLMGATACAEDQPPAGTAPPRNDAPPSAAASSQIPDVALAPAFTKLSFLRPVFITHAPDPPELNRLFVLEQPGRILVFENRSDITQQDVKVFLDIKDRTQMRHNEEGLLSLVFHPEYKENGQFFICRSVGQAQGVGRASRVSRFAVSKDDPNRADPSSEQIILDVEQPWGNHNGCTLLFGADGYLYASFGDGGAANDPHNHGQNLATLLGTIIRIDVDRAQDGLAYAIPPDNPFVNRQGARPEIWAYGLRNVWRMSFDPKTGDLWAGDVGQNLWEEICLITKGGNYGWAAREGKETFREAPRELRGVQPADPFIDPVIAYGRRDGISVTGGYTYRGSQFPTLQGVYIYADYGTGKIWGLRYENGKLLANRHINAGQTRRYVTSFGEDRNGELYACAFDQPDGRQGRIYRVSAR